MSCIMKRVVQVGVIGGLGLGAAVVVAGPHRVSAAFDQARQTINAKIDRNISDPVALRAQLRDLQAQYPERIADVRGDLSELRQQEAQLQREFAVSRGVIELADADLATLDNLLAQVESNEIRTVSYGGDPVRFVLHFENEQLSVEQARMRIAEVTATRNAHAGRLTDLERDLGFLTQQGEQLEELAAQLESEQAAFQTQMFDLDRQIDAISRNERMIEILDKRQRTIDERSRYESASLDGVQAKLADLRGRQEAQLKSLSQMTKARRYEDRVKLELDRAASTGKGYLPRAVEIQPKEDVIDVRPRDESGPEVKPMASRGE